MCVHVSSAVSGQKGDECVDTNRLVGFGDTVVCLIDTVTRHFILIFKCMSTDNSAQL